MSTLEVNIDGLVGPTHNYAGLSFGNIASQKHALTQSNPKQAALQGLRKMKFLHDLGIPQIVMPPQPRPDMQALKKLGYDDTAKAPDEVLGKIYSSSSMWTANAATISPSADTADGKVHITPANLFTKFHRSIEAYTTADYLRQMFPGSYFVHHTPLPAEPAFADEGAANHMRLCPAHADKGVEVFVYGTAGKKYPARQSKQASQTIAKQHGLDAGRAVFLQQSPEAIDAGIFHNDVIAMSNEGLLIYHEKAYADFSDKQLPDYVTTIKFTEKELPIDVAVATYFFNSQLVSLPGGGMVIIAPVECSEQPSARACMDRLVSGGYIKFVHYLDVRESMKNGGGPACLRLRMPLTDRERDAVHPYVWLNETLYNALCKWIETYYRDRITSDDLRDPLLAQESARALEKLSDIIKITMKAA